MGKQNTYIEIDFHFVREQTTRKDVILQFVPTQHQYSYLFTKPLTSDHIHHLTSRLMLHQHSFEGHINIISFLAVFSGYAI